MLEAHHGIAVPSICIDPCYSLTNHATERLGPDDTVWFIYHL